MLALSLIDYNKKNPTPWLSLLECGIKTAESRVRAVPKTERFKFPFDVLLCGSASSQTENAGKAACVVEIYDCVPFTKEYEEAACITVYPGFIYLTRKLRWLSRKFDVKGTLGFYQIDLPADVTLYEPTYDQLLKKGEKLLVDFVHANE